MPKSKSRPNHKTKVGQRIRRIKEFHQSVNNVYKRAAQNQQKLANAQSEVGVLENPEVTNGLYEVHQEYSPESFEIEFPEGDPLGVLNGLDSLENVSPAENTEND